MYQNDRVIEILTEALRAQDSQIQTAAGWCFRALVHETLMVNDERIVLGLQESILQIYRSDL